MTTDHGHGVGHAGGAVQPGGGGRPIVGLASASAGDSGRLACITNPARVHFVGVGCTGDTHYVIDNGVIRTRADVRADANTAH
jgi:hypothetical protein